MYTDNRKPVKFYFHYGGSNQPTTDQYGYWGDAAVNIRMGHRWQLNYSLSFNNTINDRGFVEKNDNEDFNAFSVDMIFRWIFAPGSEMTFAWKNSAYANLNEVENNYWRNLKNTWANQSNSLSLKILYYIDYNSLTKRKTSDH